MLLLLLLTIPAIAYSDNCTYMYDGTPFAKAAILTINGLPTNLVYNPLNKDLHFTLIDVDTLQDDKVQTKMDQYILRNNEPIIIDNVNGQAAAVDVKNKQVYIASDDGLYTLNSSDKAEFLSLKHEDIVQLFKPRNKNELYAVLYPENEVYTIDVNKNEKKKVEHVPCAFILAVDDEDNIFYECDSKYVKMLLNGFQEPIEFVGIPKNSARAIAIDYENRVILAANDGLYLLRNHNVIPVKLMDLDFIPSGIAFDEYNLYLSTNGVIYKFSSIGCYKL